MAVTIAAANLGVAVTTIVPAAVAAMVIANLVVAATTRAVRSMVPAAEAIAVATVRVVLAGARLGRLALNGVL